MKVFLAYPASQRSVAEEIRYKLLSEHETFLDVWNLKPGRRFDSEIREQIEGADLMVFLLTAESVRDGRYPRTELEIAKKKWPDPEGYVLVVQCDDLRGTALPSYLTATTILRPVGNKAAEVLFAVRDLLAERQGLSRPRWPFIDCSLPARDPDFVGRTRLFAAVDKCFEQLDRGYLVLCGGMGRGKSSFIAELIHRRLHDSPGDAPVFHFIGAHESLTSRQENVAGCLYDRLRRKYLFSEPPEWSQMPRQERLERFLVHLSAERLAEQGRREVLYVDAADQSDATAGTLLAGALPPGVFVIVTTRPNLSWLPGGPTARILDWDASDLVDDAEDVGAYLRRVASRISPPLSEEWIQRLLAQRESPVFFTVVSCLRRLWDPACPEADRKSLLEDLSLWVRAPELLVEQEAQRLLRAARQAGIAEHDVWGTLGLLAVAREGVSLAQLDALGLREGARTEEILKLATNFLRPRNPLGGWQDAFELGHPGYQREVLKRIDLDACHQRWARGCLEIWRDERSPAREYVLRHGLFHVVRARRWDDLVIMLADARFVVQSARRAGYWQIHQQIVTAVEAGDLPLELTPWLRSLERFLRLRAARLESCPGAYAQEMLNELLPRPESARLGTAPLSRQEWLELDALPERLKMAREALRRTGTLMAQEAGDTLLIKIDGPPALAGSGHTAAISSLALSPSEDCLVCGDVARRVKVWSLPGGELVADCMGHLYPVYAVAVSPDGELLASGDSLGEVKLWDRRTGRQKGRFAASAHTPVRLLAFSADGESIAAVAFEQEYDYLSGHPIIPIVSAERTVTFRHSSVSMAAEVRCWDVTTGHSMGSLRELVECLCVALSPSCRRVAIGLRTGGVRLFHLEGDREIYISAHDGPVSYVTFSPDGSLLASGGEDGCVKVWRAEDGAPVAHCDSDRRRVRAVTFSDDGKRLAASAFHRLSTWDVKLGESSWTRRWSTDVPGNVVELTFRGDRLQTLCLENHCHFEVWTPDQAPGARMVIPEMLAEHTAHTVSRSGRLVAMAARSGAFLVWSTASGELVARGEGPWRHYTKAVFSRSGAFAATIDHESSLTLTGLLESPRPGIWSSGSDFRWIRGVALSGDGRIALTGDAGGGVKSWSLEWYVAGLLGHWEASPREDITKLGDFSRGREIVEVALSSDGRVAAWSTTEGLYVWDAETKQVRTLRVPDPDAGKERFNHSVVLALALSDDGRSLVSGGKEGAAKVWDTRSGACLADLTRWTSLEAAIHEPLLPVRCVSLSADSRRVLAGADDGMVHLWDARTGATVHALNAHRGSVTAADFAPSGTLAVTCGLDATVRLWDVQAGRCVSTLLFEEPLLAATFVTEPIPHLRVTDRLGRFYAYEVAPALPQV